MMIVDEYILIKCINKGLFGEAYLGYRKGSQIKYAIKKRERSKFFILYGGKKYLNNEIFLMKDINHPNIIKLIDIKIKPNFVYIITEYCNGGNMEQFFEKYLEVNNKALPEEIVQNLMRQIIEALRYLYNKKIMHRFINLKHILINYENYEDREKNNIINGRIKIINFLFARYLKKGDLAKSILGDVLTMSPIILNKYINNINYKGAKYDEKEDIWSLGFICYKLLVGYEPFDPISLEDFVNKINIGEYFIPISLSKESISFINCMLKFDPQKRLNVDELYNHEFLRKNVKDFSKLDLDIIKKYEYTSKLKINTKNDELINEILSKPIFNLKNKEN